MLSILSQQIIKGSIISRPIVIKQITAPKEIISRKKKETRQNQKELEEAALEN